MLTHRQLFLQHLAQTSPIPLGLEIERASGCFMYDTDGRRYLDLISGISVSSLGHCHPAVVKAVEEQLHKYMHLMVYGEYIQAPQVKFAQLLVENLPSRLNSVYFTNSGTEATEGAMKLAKRITGRTEIISCYHAYHGSTQGALSLAGGEWLKNAFRPLLPDIRQIRYNVTEDLNQITNHTAAFFIEPVQGEAGAVLPSKEYIRAVRKRCDETGSLLVIDEIQTAFGRTGSLWAFEQTGVTPDILLLGKALGGGMPLGAFVASKEMMASLSENPVLGHITTFGGHPVSCAAGFAAMQELLSSGLIETIPAKEKRFRELLIHPRIKALHGRGLLFAMELENFEVVQEVIGYCIANGIVTDWFLFNDHCMRISPPLIISEAQIIEACEVIIRGVENAGK